MFRRRPEPKPQHNIIYAPLANSEINTFSLQNRLNVSDIVILLEHNRYREETKKNLYLKINGYAAWAVTKGNLWMVYTQEKDDICIEWVSLISKFRR